MASELTLNRHCTGLSTC